MAKYRLGQKVFVYTCGKLKQRTISEIITRETKKKTIVEYKFEREEDDLHFWISDSGLKEEEVFYSTKAFITSLL